MSAMRPDRVNILLVDDQPAKLLSYEVILGELGENLIKAGSAREALEHLLKTEIAVILIDVCMPELDGFELAAMIREHPRFQKTSIIFVSAIQITDPDRLRGYEAGAVDYVPVPVVPEVLRAKVKVFAELYRKTRELERLNAELEQRVAERTAELQASTERLQQSEQRRTLALAAGRMGSWDWDVATGECHWDEGQFRIFGVDPATFMPSAEAALRAVHAEDRGRLSTRARRILASGRASDVEFRIILPNGEQRWCIASAAPTLDASGRAVRLSGVTYDITERKKAEHALRDLNGELERRIEERTRERETALAQLLEAQKMDTIGQLTGGVAHDFNNLLMAIMGSLALVKKRLPDDPRTMRLIDNALQGAQRGAALTQRLLAFARRQELKPESVDVPRLVSGMEDLLERALGPGVRISKSLPADLAQVRVDANQLELALLNLAVNARDAMPLGGTLGIAACNETAASVPGLKPGAYVRISVGDSGIGMDEATLAKATEPFFTTKGPGKGTGLGLSMVHGLAAQSGGMLRISSQPGKGTMVDLWLPRATPETSREGAVEDRAPGEDAVSKTAPCTILLVDDDALVSTGTAAMLEDLGHMVIEANSGADAIELLRTSPRIDVVITDHAMPGMTGMELARRLRESHPSLPIILATGYAEFPQSETDELALPRLTKPYLQEELAAAISAVAETVSHQAKVIPLRPR
ncbi:response regulator [Arenibaculum pallidiluteum]|uniref:response regulator n=1 Tax=Arenibaculum pallidiluteum TaxID=2812559 RepID=UPI001A96865F|nr:response regulator [Arenibaculum pallidiluteum]